MASALRPAGTLPSLADIDAARIRVAALARSTPLERSAFFSDVAGCDVYLKLECWQPTRSFKVRGATNALALLSEAERARGVVTASAGNHGQAVALAAQHYGMAATVYVPRTAPDTKKRRMRALGATLNDEGADYDVAENAARTHAERTGALLVHPYSDSATVAGQGTVALEILEQLPAVGSVIVPVGGGGLVAGIGTVCRARAPAVQVTGVQSERTRAMHDAIAAGHIVDTSITPTLADGLAGCTDAVALQRLQELQTHVHLVSEAAIADAMRALFMHDGIVAEGSGAVGIAALTSGAVRPARPTVVVITGGNVDAAQFASILAEP